MSKDVAHKKEKKEKVVDVEASDVTKKDKKNKKEKKDKKDKKEKKEKKDKKRKASEDEEEESKVEEETTEAAPTFKKLKAVEVISPLKATVVSGSTPQNGLIKSFYNASTNKTTNIQARDFYKENTIDVSGDQDFLPVLKFNEAGFRSEMLDVTKGFKAPSPIQAACWPIVLSGRDIIGIAETG